MRLKRKDSVHVAVKRVARKRVAAALVLLHECQGGPVGAEAIHSARRQIKKVRALVRLARDDLGRRRFARANRCLRKASRPLSRLRDAKVLIDTLNAVSRAAGTRSASVARLRMALEAHREEMHEELLNKRRLRQSICNNLRQAERQITRGSSTHQGWKAIAGGLRRTYQRGRTAMASAARNRSDKALHEARKRGKDLLHSAEFLVAAGARSIRPVIRDVHELTDLLGNDHDLAMLQKVINDRFNTLMSNGARQRLERLVARRRRTLQQRALKLGRKVYAETPAAFVTRTHAHWHASRAWH